MQSLASSQKILIVDDEMDIANTIKKYLVNAGFEAICFTDPLVALEHFVLLDKKYQCIITDLRMPGMSGLIFTNKIREINTSVKVFLISAFDTSDLENNSEYKSAKIERVIQKPIKLSILKEILTDTLWNNNNNEYKIKDIQ
jgi:DNA-binding NtrC family response regulator